MFHRSTFQALAAVPAVIAMGLCAACGNLIDGGGNGQTPAGGDAPSFLYPPVDESPASDSGVASVGETAVDADTEVGAAPEGETDTDGVVRPDGDADPDRDPVADGDATERETDGGDVDSGMDAEATEPETTGVDRDFETETTSGEPEVDPEPEPEPELEPEPPVCETQTDAYGLTWVSIPGGTFEMGCSPNDEFCDPNEKPRHAVTVPSLKMTQTEITQAQYLAVIGSNPSYFQRPNWTQCLNCPVESVDWNQAELFCEAVGGRLPSEAEWEYAARAGTMTKYYCGDDPSCLDGVAWYDSNIEGIYHPVKGKTPNAFCLYDMLGNVWEWNADCWHADYEFAPSDGSPWSDVNCSVRILRGGGFYYGTDMDLRVSNRFADMYGLYHFLGFRCAKDY